MKEEKEEVKEEEMVADKDNRQNMLLKVLGINKIKNENDYKIKIKLN